MKHAILTLCVLFCAVVSTRAQENPDYANLSYEEIDSFIMLNYHKSDFSSAVLFAEQGMKKAKAEFGTLDSVYCTFVNNTAFFYNKLGQYSEAEPLMKEESRIKLKIYGESHKYYIQSLNSLAILSFRMGKYDLSESHYKKTIELSKKHLGIEHAFYSNGLNNLASLYLKLGKLEAVEPLYRESMTLMKNIVGTEHTRYGTACNNLGYLYYKTARYEAAEPLWLKAISIQKNTVGEQSAEYATALNNLANLYKTIGKYEEAEPLVLQAANIIKKLLGDQHPKYATYLTNLAGLYESEGNYEEAEHFYKESLPIMKQSVGDEHQDYATSLLNLGNLYVTLERYEEAEKFYLKSCTILEKAVGKLHPDYAMSLSGLGSIYKDKGDYDKALELCKEALAINEQLFGKGHPSCASFLHTLSAIYKKKGDLDQAYAYSMSSVAVNAEGFNEKLSGMFLEREEGAFLYEPTNCCGELDSEKLLALANLEYNSQEQINNSLNNLLTVSKAQAIESNNPKKLKSHYNLSKAAMKINENTREGFAGKRNKLKALKNNSVFVKFGIDAAILLADPAYYNEAFSFAEQNKSVLLADAVKGNRARVFGDLPDSLALKEMELQKQKDKLKKQKAESTSAEATTAITQKENALNQEIDAFLKSLKDKYPNYHHLKYENITVNAESIQEALAPKTLLLEYFVTDSTTYLFAVSNQSVELFPVAIKKEELTKQIETLRLALSDYEYILSKANRAQKLYTEAAYWFYKELLSVALEGKDMENLIVITDGELGHLPFEAFLLEEVPQGEIDYTKLHYLVNDYNISYNYSATLWKENLELKGGNNNHQMLACAAAYPEVDSSLLDLRLPNIFSLRHSLKPLDEAKNEITSLEKIFDGTFITGDSTNEAFFKKYAADYGVIHLAMHGILHPRVPMLSSLAFTENRDSLEDNFLQAYEIAHLHLNADLIVLSACETGYGKFEQGEGVISLARSFMYAGTPSLVVSLWQVNDQSTAVIMKFFYQYIADGLAKDVALRQAKLDYLNIAKDIAGHPAFWSPFIQLGNTAPVKIYTKGRFRPWLIGIGVFALLLIVGVFLNRRRKMS